jgi:hypothetical protein
MMDTEVQELADAALTELRVRGWQSGGLRNRETGMVCMMGAVYEAERLRSPGHRYHPSRHAVVKRLVTQLHKTIHEQHGRCADNSTCDYMYNYETPLARVEHWNDLHAGGQEAVERILEKVAAG